MAPYGAEAAGFDLGGLFHLPGMAPTPRIANSESLGRYSNALTSLVQT